MKPRCAMFYCFLVIGCGYLLTTASAHEVGNPLYENHLDHLEYKEEDGNWYHEQEQDYRDHEQRFEENPPEYIEEQRFEEQHYEQPHAERYVHHEEQHEQQHDVPHEQSQEVPSYDQLQEEHHDEQHQQEHYEQPQEEQQHFEFEEQRNEEQQPEIFEHVQEQEHAAQVQEHFEEQHQPRHIEHQEQQHFEEQHQQQVEYQQHDAAKVRQIWDQQYTLNHDHIQRHMVEENLDIPALEGLSVAEMQYHLFVAHDYDKNEHLDGLEMIHSIFHDEQSKPPDARQLYGEQDLVNHVEFLLDQYDADRDGMLSYPEFVTSLLRQRM